MRFAAIADVHGNYLALEAVIADIRAQGITDIVNLGDMASGPLDARRTMDLLMALDAVHVLGNHDRYLIDRPPEKMGSWDRPAHAQLDEKHLDWLRAVPPTQVYRDRVFLCHATPASDEVYWLETVRPDGAVTLAALEQIEAAATGIAQRLVLCAHSHLARAVQLGDGRLIVNPGSVGSPGYRDIHPYPHVDRSRHAGRALRDPGIYERTLARYLPACALRPQRDGGAGAPERPAGIGISVGDRVDQVRILLTPTASLDQSLFA